MSSSRSTVILLLAIFWTLQVAANLCFKEGGTDAAHRLLYFIAGNAGGILSTAVLMGLYARMNVNLAMVVGTAGTFLLFQGTLWLLYRAPLTGMQCFGILIVGVGTVLASWARGGGVQSTGEVRQPREAVSC